ncbi:unnamed protein product, partial [Closterium sp. NIES-54]
MPQERTLEIKGARTVHVRTAGYEKECLTIMLAVTASGLKLPPYVVFKRKTIPKVVVPRGESLLPLRMLLVPLYMRLMCIMRCARIVIRAQVRGWMDENLVQDWTTQLLVPFMRPLRDEGCRRKDVLLVPDLYRRHLTEAVGQTIRLFKLARVVIPGDCTPLVQPLDVSINRAFKAGVRHRYGTWFEEDGITSTTPAARASRSAAPRVTPCCSPHVAPCCPASRAMLQPARRALLQPARRTLLPSASRPAAASMSRPTAASASRPAALRVAPCCSQRVAPYCSQRIALCCPARPALLQPAHRALLQPARHALLPHTSCPAAASASRPTAARASRSAALHSARPAALSTAHPALQPAASPAQRAACCSVHCAPCPAARGEPCSAEPRRPARAALPNPSRAALPRSPAPSSRPAATTAAAAAARATATACAGAAGSAGSAASAGGAGGATGSAGGAAGAGGAGPTTDRHCLSWPLSLQLQRLGVGSGGHCLSRTTPPLSSFASGFFSEPVQVVEALVFYVMHRGGSRAAALGACESAAALGASESAAALGASEYAAALGARASLATGPSTAEALHTFTFDLGASRCFFRDCTTLTPLAAPLLVSLADPTGGPVVARASSVLSCLAVPSGSLSGLHLPTFSINL